MPNPHLPVLAALLFLIATSLRGGEAPLPDPFTALDGRVIANADDWRTHRRSELLEIFRREIYGRAPLDRPASLNFTVTGTQTGMMDGAATRKLVRIAWTGPGGQGGIDLVLFVPTKREHPEPCFLLICNREKDNIDATRAVRSPFWPAEALIARGYAAAAFFVGDVAPDRDDGFHTGVHAVFDPKEQTRAGDAWGTIAGWAWGASRAIDYLTSDADLDAKRIAVVGHSRGGKTALWCGAQDERVALTVSNDSGCAGAAISRGKKGESIAKINAAFPHWFCANFKRWNGRETELPVDQHELLALCAPRLLYVASASQDEWADPAAEFRSCVAAAPAWTLFGHSGFSITTMPEPEQPLHAGRIGYHLRTGKHDLTEYDWTCFMDFADRHLR